MSDPVYDQSQVVGMLEMALICSAVEVTIALAKDFTELEAPAHVQDVDQARVSLVSESTVVH